MDDILETIVDFEKKFFRLIKHLVMRPQLVFESLSNKENKYTKPFKFYSIISSLALALIFISNRFDFLQFWDDDYLLPNYWIEYYENADEIGLTLLPILGFLYFIVLLAIMSFLLIRSPKRSFLFHLSYHMYVFSAIILYLIILLPPLVLFVRETGLAEYNLSEFIFYIILIGVPILFIARSLWAWTGRPVSKAIKILIVIGGSSLIYYTTYLDSALEYRVNNYFFYKKDWQPEIKSDLSPNYIELARYHNDVRQRIQNITHFDEYPLIASIPHFFVDSVNIGILRKDSIALLAAFEQKNQLLNLNLFNLTDHGAYAITENRFDETGEENNTTNSLWEIGNEGIKEVLNDSTILNRFSFLLSYQKYLLLTGSNKKTQGSIYQISEGQIQPIYSLEEESTSVDALFTFSNETKDLLFLSSKTTKESLESISLHKFRLSDSLHQETKLFTNTFAKIPPQFNWGYYNSIIHNPQLLVGQDSSSIYVAFQIMTDKTFELQLFVLDLELNIRNQSRFTTAHNLTYFDECRLYEDKLYVLGRVFPIVTNNSVEGKAFIAKFSVAALEEEGFQILEITEWTDHFNLYMPDYHLDVKEDNIQILRFGYMAEKWSMPRF
jgi:hypothetical protein